MLEENGTKHKKSSEEKEVVATEENLSSFLEEHAYVQQVEEQASHSCSPHNITLEDNTPIAKCKEDEANEATKKICDVMKVVSVTALQFSSSFTSPLLDLRINPFQEEGNDESMGDITQVIEEIIKLM